MNINKLTQRSLEAVQSAQSIAVSHNNQQVDQEHLCAALLGQEDSLIKSRGRSRRGDSKAAAGNRFQPRGGQDIRYAGS